MNKKQFMKMVEKKKQSLWDQLLKSNESAEQDLKRLTELRDSFKEFADKTRMYGTFRAQCIAVVQACQDLIRMLHFGKMLIANRMFDGGEFSRDYSEYDMNSSFAINRNR